MRARGGGAGVDLVSEVVRELRVEVDVEDRDRCPGRGPAAVAAIGECGGNGAGGNGAGGQPGGRQPQRTELERQDRADRRGPQTTAETHGKLHCPSPVAGSRGLALVCMMGKGGSACCCYWICDRAVSTLVRTSSRGRTDRHAPGRGGGGDQLLVRPRRPAAVHEGASCSDERQDHRAGKGFRLKPLPLGGLAPPWTGPMPRCVGAPCRPKGVGEVLLEHAAPVDRIS